MLTPIPVSLLPLSITVREPINGDYGGEYGEPKTIQGARFERAESLIRGGYVLTDGAKGLLFIDAVNSSGAFEIPVGSLISMDGKEEVAASKVSAFEGFNGVVHHWEVEVS